MINIIQLVKEIMRSFKDPNTVDLFLLNISFNSVNEPVATVQKIREDCENEKNFDFYSICTDYLDHVTAPPTLYLKLTRPDLPLSKFKF